MAPLRDIRQTEARRCTEAMRNLLLAYKAHLEDQLRGTGVTLPQLRMLKVVEHHSGVSAASIARLCHITPQTLHSMLTRATREGWIVRGSSEANSRFVTVSLTPRGKAIVKQGMELAARIEAQAWHGLSLGAIQAVREGLEAGLANLQKD